MINLEALLTPISPEDPCGPDVAYDPEMFELQKALEGKPETQFSQAEEPRWNEVRDRCVGLLKRSKNLRVAVVLTLALLRMEGLPGFRDGLAVISAMLHQFWDGIWPRLDPEDHNDPTERVNILASMMTPIATFGDPMQFLKRLRQASLSDSAVGRFTLDDLAPLPGPDGVPGAATADPVQVQAAFRDTPPAKLEEQLTAVDDATASAKAIDEFITEAVGAGRAPDWGPLLSLLGDLRKAIVPFIPTAVAAEAVGSEAGAAAGASGVAAVPGAILSRDDVLRTLDRICEYYEKAEPSSPVPLLLRRARRIAAMNFIEIIGELTPEALGTAQNVTGTKPSE
jgi:type VI secretion system protein ImpA